ncbi:hypothetical protein [Streptomyces beijiangensis]|uniref:Uncharacterized protein n=1 Tax=Streptomyces beijiangensis TaxID=163361 RepID=A0A939JHA6_9ACTN|nr:hypothetical protein [Streptomyces beijiangensis]MBO0512402.1 hypothetical protein [Streptomyces beijiangensis]
MRSRLIRAALGAFAAAALLATAGTVAGGDHDRTNRPALADVQWGAPPEAPADGTDAPKDVQWSVISAAGSGNETVPQDVQWNSAPNGAEGTETTAS